MATTIHPFERSGLGRAPFRFLGLSVEVGPIQRGDITVGAPGQPMGVCDHCGQGIKYVCHITSADNHEFCVGCDCVKKLARADNAEYDPVIQQIATAKRKLDRDLRHVRETKRIEEGWALYKANRATFEAMPHPHEYWAKQGQTQADRIDWHFANAGNSGQLQIVRFILDTLKGKSHD